MLIRLRTLPVWISSRLQLWLRSARTVANSQRHPLKDRLFYLLRIGDKSENREPFFAYGLFLAVFIFWLLVIGVLSKYIFGCYR
jgi:hypothetical protein